MKARKREKDLLENIQNMENFEKRMKARKREKDLLEKKRNIKDTKAREKSLLMKARENRNTKAREKNLLMKTHEKSLQCGNFNSSYNETRGWKNETKTTCYLNSVMQLLRRCVGVFEEPSEYCHHNCPYCNTCMLFKDKITIDEFTSRTERLMKIKLREMRSPRLFFNKLMKLMIDMSTQEHRVLLQGLIVEKTIYFEKGSGKVPEKSLTTKCIDLHFSSEVGNQIKMGQMERSRKIRSIWGDNPKYLFVTGKRLLRENFKKDISFPLLDQNGTTIRTCKYQLVGSIRMIDWHCISFVKPPARDYWCEYNDHLYGETSFDFVRKQCTDIDFFFLLYEISN